MCELTPEEIQKIVWLEEEVKAGSVLVAELTDKCRKLEAQLAKGQEDYVAQITHLGDVHREITQKLVNEVMQEGLAKAQDCPECLGEKEVEVDCGFEGFRMVPCPTCQGTGKAKKLKGER